jgi:copper resistance protein C
LSPVACSVRARLPGAVGATTNGSIGAVRIWFVAEIEPVFSTLRLTDAQGRQINQCAGQLNPMQSRMLEVNVPSLAPGVYHVFWHVVACDWHVTEGDYQFTVRQ